jgi:RNA polymerase sigma factor (sigma-70 family)
MHELWRLLDVVLSRRQDPQRDREVMLSHMEGEAYAEIAKRLGISRERVRQIHSDVRDKLRAELEDG